MTSLSDEHLTGPEGQEVVRPGDIAGTLPLALIRTVPYSRTTDARASRYRAPTCWLCLSLERGEQSHMSVFGINVVKQWEKGVVFRLGRVRPTLKEPGLRFTIPVVDRLRRVSTRIVTLPVDSQKIITRDNVSIDVAAVAYYRITDPIKSIIEIEKKHDATYQIAQTTVRNVIGQSTLDEVLSETAKINEKIKEILATITEEWGVYISTVEVKDIQLPEALQRAMAKQAEAEREKRAKIIAAEGEQLSATKLGEAADIIEKHPIALQLRNLQVLSDVAAEHNSTIIFPAQFMDTLQSVKAFVNNER
jgi:regulator of protease activity HflC (stomatin/prohibitin superfamily)